MNRSAAEVALVPPGVVTVTSTVPAACVGVLTLSSVAESTCTSPPAEVPNCTLAPSRFVPVTVTVVPPAMLPSLWRERRHGRFRRRHVRVAVGTARGARPARRRHRHVHFFRFMRRRLDRDFGRRDFVHFARARRAEVDFARVFEVRPDDLHRVPTDGAAFGRFHRRDRRRRRRDVGVFVGRHHRALAARRRDRHVHCARGVRRRLDLHFARRDHVHFAPLGAAEFDLAGPEQVRSLDRHATPASRCCLRSVPPP